MRPYDGSRGPHNSQNNVLHHCNTHLSSLPLLVHSARGLSAQRTPSDSPPHMDPEFADPPSHDTLVFMAMDGHVHILITSSSEEQSIS